MNLHIFFDQFTSPIIAKASFPPITGTRYNCKAPCKLTTKSKNKINGKKNKGTKQKEKVDVAICDLIIFIAWK